MTALPDPARLPLGLALAYCLCAAFDSRVSSRVYRAEWAGLGGGWHAATSVWAGTWQERLLLDCFSSALPARSCLRPGLDPLHSQASLLRALAGFQVLEAIAMLFNPRMGLHRDIQNMSGLESPRWLWEHDRHRSRLSTA